MQFEVILRERFDLVLSEALVRTATCERLGTAFGQFSCKDIPLHSFPYLHVSTRKARGPLMQCFGPLKSTHA